MSRKTPIRVGVIGTGVMGGNHTRVALSLPGCHFVGIFDADQIRAAEVAQQFSVPAYDSLEGLCAEVDAVIVATPTVTHTRVAAACLTAGCHVLLEKPIAATVEDAEALVALGAQNNRVLMIGHVERYNPAVTAVMALLDRQELFACELHRLSTSPGRDRSADIIFDLMIHDIDLALAFVRAPVVSITAMGHRISGDLIDHVTALLRFETGTIVTLTASAVSQERVRKARLYTRSAQFTLDFANREVFIHRQGRSSIATSDGQYRMAGMIEQVLVPGKEPLGVEQEHFLQCIRTGANPLTDAAAGLQALRLAYAIQQRVNEQLAIISPQ